MSVTKSYYLNKLPNTFRIGKLPYHIFCYIIFNYIVFLVFIQVYNINPACMVVQYYKNNNYYKYIIYPRRKTLVPL